MKVKCIKNKQGNTDFTINKTYIIEKYLNSEKLYIRDNVGNSKLNVQVTDNFEFKKCEFKIIGEK